MRQFLLERIRGDEVWGVQNLETGDLIGIKPWKGFYNTKEDAIADIEKNSGFKTHQLNITPEMKEKSLKGMPISRRQTQRKALLA